LIGAVNFLNRAISGDEQVKGFRLFTAAGHRQHPLTAQRWIATVRAGAAGLLPQVGIGNGILTTPPMERFQPAWPFIEMFGGRPRNTISEQLHLSAERRK
jgi:hypothetical protein